MFLYHFMLIWRWAEQTLALFRIYQVQTTMLKCNNGKCYALLLTTMEIIGVIYA